VQGAKAASPAPVVPKVPKQESSDDDDEDEEDDDDDDDDEEEESDESDSEPEPKAAEKPSETAPAAKSPLLTGHRVSVTSDMDDVSLDSGEYIYSVRNNRGLCDVGIFRGLCFQSRNHPHPFNGPTYTRVYTREYMLIAEPKLTFYRKLKGSWYASKTTTA
jgi:hypothetical protein